MVKVQWIAYVQGAFVFGLISSTYKGREINVFPSKFLQQIVRIIYPLSPNLNTFFLQNQPSAGFQLNK